MKASRTRRHWNCCGSSEHSEGEQIDEISYFLAYRMNKEKRSSILLRQEEIADFIRSLMVLSFELMALKRKKKSDVAELGNLLNY